MFARRLVVSLALLALTSNISVLAGLSAKASASEGQAFTLVSLKHETAGALTRILIESSAPPLYTVFRPTGRLIVVDLPGGEGSQLAPQYAVKSGLVDSIAVRQMNSASAGRTVTRIEVSMRNEARDRSSVDGNTLVLELSPETQGDDPRYAVEKPVSPSGVYVYPTPVAKSKAAPAPDRAQPKSSVTQTTPEPKLVRPAPSPARMNSATMIRGVRSETADGAVRIVVDADGAAPFKDFVLANPWRVVVDISGVRSAVGNKTASVGAGLVDRFRVGQPEPNMVRIVLDTKTKAPYRVEREGDSLVITVGEANAAMGAKANRAVEVKAQAQNNVKPTVAAATRPESKVAGQRVENKAETKTEPGIPSDLLAQSNSRAGAQPNRSLPLPSQPASKPASSAKEVITSAPQPTGARSMMDVQRNPAAQPSASASRQRSEMAFCDATYVGGLISFDLRAGVDVRDMLRFISQQYGINFIVDKSVGPVPVDIRVTDIPWNQVMESVLRANRLGAVCESNGRMIRIATLLAVKEEEEARRQIAEEQAKQIPLVTKIIHLKYARAFGALGASGAGASGRGGGGGGAAGAGAAGSGTLLSIVSTRLSTRGRIEMDSRTNSLIVTDLPEYMQVVEDMVSKLDRPEPQVEIEARIVIANRNFIRDLGVELASGVTGSKGKTGLFETSPVQLVGGSITGKAGGASNSGSNNGGSSGGNNNGSSGGSGSDTQIGPNLLGPFADTALRAGTATSVLALTTGAIGTSILSTTLSASETKGHIRTIASPRVTTTDNKTAEIINGVQIPVQTVSNNTITTTFVTAALRLEITPQIVEETGEVQMHIVAENNTVNFSLANSFNNGTPGIDTQSAESTVLIQDGGTTVMGGINVDTEGHTLNRTPGVSRIPVLGELFKRRSTRRDSSEILFFVTPRIVRTDGMLGPRSSQRSSVEGRPNPNAPQRAVAAPAAGVKDNKPAQPAQDVKVAAGNKGGQ
jgi:type IV pilus assembly protein PilQ